MYTWYSPFCVPAKVAKLIGLKRLPFLSPTNLIIFACTQNGEYTNKLYYAFLSICLIVVFILRTSCNLQNLKFMMIWEEENIFLFGN
jgi:hypothetical protein